MRLKNKESLFVKELIDNDFNATEAYCRAWKTDNRKVGSVEGCKLLKKDKILVAIEVDIGSNKRISWEEGLNRRQVMKALREIILGEVPLLDKNGKPVKDENGKIVKIGHSDKSIISAINTLAKLIGDFAPDDKTITLKDETGEDLSKLSEEELKERKVKILNELSK